MVLSPFWVSVTLMMHRVKTKIPLKSKHDYRFEMVDTHQNCRILDKEDIHLRQVRLSRMNKKIKPLYQIAEGLWRGSQIVKISFMFSVWGG